MKFDHPDAYRCFNPRDPAQSVTDSSTWKVSGNAILISATMLYAVHGERGEICWDKVAALADLCDDPSFAASDSGRGDDPTLEETNAMLRKTLGHPRRRARRQ